MQWARWLLGGFVVLDNRAIALMHIPEAALEAAIARERKELLRRSRLYRGDKAPPVLEGLTVILVDDGLATGYTMLAAARSVRRQRPARIVVAVPVALRETLDRLGAEVDKTICVTIPPRLVAVGQFYEDFSQTTDEQVRATLASFNRLMDAARSEWPEISAARASA